MARCFSAKLAIALALCLLFAAFAGCVRSAPQEQHDLEAETTPASDEAYPESEPEQEPTAEEAPPRLSSEELAAIRAGVPYGGLSLSIWQPGFFPVFIDCEDELGMDIKRYVNAIHIGDRVVLSMDELSDCYILWRAIEATMPFTAVRGTVRDFGREIQFLPELEPIAAVIAEKGGGVFWLREHVEQSIELLFGDVVLEEMQNSFGDHHLVEPEGVYYRPPRGGGVAVYSVVLSYQDLGGRYRAVVAYIHLNNGLYQRPIWPPGYWEDIASYWDEDVAETLLAHVQNPSNQFHIYLLRQDGGSLLFERQIAVSTESS